MGIGRCGYEAADDEGNHAQWYFATLVTLHFKFSASRVGRCYFPAYAEPALTLPVPAIVRVGGAILMVLPVQISQRTMKGAVLSPT